MMRKMKGWLEKLNTKFPPLVAILGPFTFFFDILKNKKTNLCKNLFSSQCVKMMGFTYEEDMFFLIAFVEYLNEINSFM